MNLGSYLSMLITECRRLGLINPTHTVPIKVDTSAKYSDEEIFSFTPSCQSSSNLLIAFKRREAFCKTQADHQRVLCISGQTLIES